MRLKYSFLFQTENLDYKYRKKIRSFLLVEQAKIEKKNLINNGKVLANPITPELVI